MKYEFAASSAAKTPHFFQEIRVYNQKGPLIDQSVDFSPSGKNTWIRTGDWPTGLYYIGLQMPEQVITQPITIIR